MTPVLMLHALGVHSAMWAEQRRELQRSGHRVLTPDQRGYGGTPLGADPPSLALVADDVAGLLDAAGVGEVVLVGASMGGYVAAEFLRRHPGRVRALALVSTRADADDPAALAERAALATAVLAAQLRGRTLDAVVPRLLGATTLRERPDVAAAVRRMLDDVPGETLAWCLRAIAARTDAHAVLAGTDVPGLVVAGEEDGLVPFDAARRVAEALPQGRLVVLPGTGHLCPLESPELVAGVLTDFVNRVGAGAPAGRTAR